MPVAIITGGGTGIGRGAAVALAAAGFSVALAGRRKEVLDETAAILGRAVSTLVVPTDVSDSQSVAALFEEVRGRFGRLDLLFNNAGSGVPSKPLANLMPEEIASVINSNVLGSLYCAREAMAMMSSQSPSGGRIINNGSVSAHAPRLNMAPYTAAKHAITGLTKALILEGRHHGICVSQIDIGNAASERTDRMEHGVLQADGRVLPEPRISLDQVAAAILYLAQLPLEVNVPFMTIMPRTMPLFGRG